MSRRLLFGGDSTIQDMTDDLESFFWVILYICLRYLTTNLSEKELVPPWVFPPRLGRSRTPLREEARDTGRSARVRHHGRIRNRPVKWNRQPAVKSWIMNMIIPHLERLTSAQIALLRIPPPKYPLDIIFNTPSSRRN